MFFLNKFFIIYRKCRTHHKNNQYEDRNKKRGKDKLFFIKIYI